MILGIIIIIVYMGGDVSVVNPVDISLIIIMLDPVVPFALQVNTAGTCPPLLLALRL